MRSRTTQLCAIIVPGLLLTGCFQNTLLTPPTPVLPITQVSDTIVGPTGNNASSCDMASLLASGTPQSAVDYSFCLLLGQKGDTYSEGNLVNQLSANNLTRYALLDYVYSTIAFQNLPGISSGTNQDYLNAVFNILEQKIPSTADNNFYLNQLSAGWTRQQVFQSITSSGDFKAKNPILFGAYATSIGAAASTNTIVAPAYAANCSVCYGGKEVALIGNNGGTLTYNLNIVLPGIYNLQINYINGDPTARKGDMVINGSTAVAVTFPPSGGSGQVSTITLTVQLQSGANTLYFYGPTFLPDMVSINLFQ